MALFGAMITATFALLCVFALVRARRALRQAHRVQALLREAKETKSRDAPATGKVVLTGTVGCESAPATAPFTNEPVLWARASAQTNIGAVLDAWTVHVDEMTVDDGSGVLAKVKLAGADVRVEEHSVSRTDSPITAYMNAIGRTPGSGEFYWQMVLRPGDVVSVLGTVSPPASTYRTSTTVSLSSSAGELIVFDPSREEAEPARRDNYARMAIVGIFVFTLATAFFAVLAAT